MKELSVETEDQQSIVQIVADRCIHCNLCLQDCSLLKEHGNPGEISLAVLKHGQNHYSTAFSCCLCGLCTSRCPEHLPVDKMFLMLRRNGRRQKKTSHTAHRPLCFFEWIGSSKLFTLYLLPPGCDTVFFPGCALPGIRFRETLALYRTLKSSIPSLGIVLDCCNKPSHDLGNQQHFDREFKKKTARLSGKNIRRILTACPSCQKIFEQYSRDFELKSVFQVISEKTAGKLLQIPAGQQSTFCIHDPCSSRTNRELHETVRKLLRERGTTVIEPEHTRESTLCCGEGGGAALLNSKTAESLLQLRRRELNGKTTVTYCAGCINRLGSDKTLHLVDLLITDKKPAQPRRVSSAKAYCNRLYLKFRLLYS